MSQEYKYKTVLSTLKKGEKPCYRAVVISNGTINAETLYKSAAERVGLKKETIRYIAELLFSQIVDYAKDSINVVIPDFMGTSLSIRGTFDSANSAFEKDKHQVRLNINPKGALATACAEGVGVNVTEGNRCRITSVLDAVAKTEGIIVAGEDVEVFVAGGTFLVDTTAEDEGVWLEDANGQITAFGTVTASTATTLDVVFETLPEPGAYKFVVATRGGLGKDYGVSIARRNVEIRGQE